VGGRPPRRSYVTVFAKKQRLDDRGLPQPVLHPLQMYEKILNPPSENWPVSPSFHRPTLSECLIDELTTVDIPRQRSRSPWLYQLRTQQIDRMRQFQWVILAGIVVVALNLRPAVASVSPILETIRAELELSYTAVSLLTTIPTLCMGVFALTIPTITDRIGRERGVFWGSTIIAVATVTRLVSRQIIVLFGSTLFIGIGIAITQTLLPSLVTEYFTDRKSFATGLYTASLTVGAALAGGATAPLENLLESWPAALAVWTIPAAIAVPLWYISWKQATRQGGGSITTSTQAHLPWRNRWAIVLTLFFGGSSTVYFFILTWLAPRYVALGWSESQAGILLTGFFLMQLGGNLGVSAFGDRLTDQRPLFALMSILIIFGALGIAVVPRLLPWGWILLLGIGTGGLFTLGLTLPVTYAAGPTAADGLTSVILGGGYLIAALGPFVTGVIRDVTGSYSIIFVGLVALGSILFGFSLLFDPDREVITVKSSGRTPEDSI